MMTLRPTWHKHKLIACASLLCLSFTVKAQNSLCIAPPIQFDSKTLMQEGHVKVSADRAEIIEERSATFIGNVEISSDTAQIKANEAFIEDNENTHDNNITMSFHIRALQYWGSQLLDISFQNPFCKHFKYSKSETEIDQFEAIF